MEKSRSDESDAAVRNTKDLPAKRSEHINSEFVNEERREIALTRIVLVFQCLRDFRRERCSVENVPLLSQRCVHAALTQQYS
jgi:hypothetical protein